jgi:hypothetical protein
MTPETKKALYKQLSQPFPEEAIERTDGRQTGKGYSTTGIKAQFIINRLNEALGIGGWRTHRKVVVKELTTNSGRKAYEAVCDLVLELGEWLDGSFVPFAGVREGWPTGRPTVRGSSARSCSVLWPRSLRGVPWSGWRAVAP